jgi:3-oxoacyl-[acyl-carrier-protein] synthase II
LNIKRVVVTGMGVICPIGLNLEEFWTNLVAGKSGVNTISSLDASNHAVKVAGEVRNFDPTEHMDLKTVQRTRRAIHFAIPATKEAVANAKLDITQEAPERVGIVSSTMLEDDYTVQRQWASQNAAGARRVDPLFFTKAAPSAVSLQLGMLLRARGPNISVNSLCASGTDTIGTALNFIRFGYADVMIAAASDASLDETTISALSVLGALTKEPDPDKASRPFDLNRSGFVYGEGCGVLVLESLEHAQKRGVPILAEVGGVGWIFDAYDATAPNPETEALAMKNALKEAGVSPEEVDYINAHGTSTRLNDVSETKAIKLVFGDRAYQIPISSNKSMFGHMITAGGAVESIGAILTMNHSIIPPTIHYETPDPDCDLDYVPNVAREAEIDICLKDSFGLGGQNCCLVLKKYKEA